MNVLEELAIDRWQPSVRAADGSSKNIYLRGRERAMAGRMLASRK